MPGKCIFEAVPHVLPLYLEDLQLRAQFVWPDFGQGNSTCTPFSLLVGSLETVWKYLFWVNSGNSFLGADHQLQSLKNPEGDNLIMFQGHQEDL